MPNFASGRLPEPLFEGFFVDGKSPVWMSHGDHVRGYPAGFEVVAGTENAPVAAIQDASRHLYGVQFHPEVNHTPRGEILIDTFVRKICGCTGRWTPGQIIEDAVARIRRQVGEGQVILGLSGGVDSSVAAALIHRAIGDQLTCVFVDNGLLRLAEGDQVMATFARNMGVKVIRVNAEERFLAALRGVEDPGAQAQDHRQPVHRDFRGGGGEARRMPAGWPRGRSIPTSSNRPGRKPARRTTSRAITMSADCPST